MTLRNLPELRAERLPRICAFEYSPDALSKFNAGLRAARSDDATISILDVIGDDPWSGAGVSSKRISAALRHIGEQDIFVDLNSPGGDFFEGVAIYNALRAHPKKVTVRILGLAASAASIIAMAGDEIQIGKAGFLMVHNAWGVTVGNRHAHREAAEMMEPFDDAMASVYSDRAGVKKTKAAEWMDNETWFNGEQAVEAGLATSFLDADEVSEDNVQAEANKSVNAMRRVDSILAKHDIPRSERRALLREVKGGTHDAAPPVTHDADDAAAMASIAALVSHNINVLKG